MASAQPETLDASGLRLAELIGAMSLAVDLGLGQPTEHVPWRCDHG